MVGLGGAIPAGPWGVVVVVLGLDNVPGCCGGGCNVVPSELTPGLLGGGLPPSELTPGLLGGGLPPLGEGVLLPDDVSAYIIPVAAAPLTINATITRKNPENSAIFLLLLVIPWLYLPYYHLFLSCYLRRSNYI
jgi:hypothetical protein